LDVSFLNSLTNLSCYNNPMSCIRVSQSQLDNKVSSWIKDVTADWSLTCPI